MRVLLDENLPHDLRHHLAGHETMTVAYMGWCGVKNGALLRLAASHGIDVMLTLDVGVLDQHNPKTLPIAIMILRPADGYAQSIMALGPAILLALESLQPRTFRVVSA